MGVTGLLPFASAASRPCGCSELRGQTVAVDAYCWLHRGAVGAAQRLAQGDKTDAHVKYCMKYVNMLLSFNIKPILVFDGRHLPAKAMTEDKRRESRKVAKKRAADLLRMGKLEEARSHLRRCIDITHEMALDLIKECRNANVDCIVAPYEADAQLAYLNKINLAQVVITEDSDLLLFGCNKILFKMDINGNGLLMESEKLPLIMKCPLERYSFDKFRQMCILSGCDYLASLPGIGLVKARQFINSTRDSDISNAIKKIPSFFNKSQMQVTDEYRDGFMKAEATFKHQLVYDPIQRTMVPLTDVEEEGTDPRFCTNAGKYLDPDIAFQLALGNLDPFTLHKMDNWNPDDNIKPIGIKTNGWNQRSVAPHKSIWHKDYQDHRKSNTIEEKKVNALSIPCTRPIVTKTINTDKINEEEKGLTIDDLSAMYCKEPPAKKKRIIVPETQDFDGDDETTLIDDSDDNDNNSLKENYEDTSPILTKSSRTYKTLKNNGSFTLKKMSKFQRTIIDETNCVQSKFFEIYTPESSNSNEVLKEISSHVTNNFPINESEDLVIPKLSEIKNKCEISAMISDIDESPVNESINNRKLTSDKLDWLNADDSQKNISHLKKILNFSPENTNKSKNPFKKTLSLTDEILDKDIYPLDQTITAYNSQISINNDVIDYDNDKVLNVDIEKASSQNSIVSNNANSDEIKPKAVCRRPGLLKKKAPTAGQTLLTVFGFKKKSQLRHLD